MTKRERDQAAMLLGALAEVLGQELTEARLLLLLEDLDDVPFDRLKHGIGLARRRCKFVPAPVELRALCKEQPIPALGPSLQAIRAERERVKQSWKKTPPVPTLQEMVDSCFTNAAMAERHLEMAKDRMERLPQGDNELPALREQIARHKADYEHWSGYVGHYRERVAREGGSTVPAVALPEQGARQ